MTNPLTMISVAKIACLATLILSLLTACGTMGDTASVREATDLAVDCRTDQALAAVDRAEQGGGLGFHLAGLQRVAILREAGRNAEATRALADYRSHPDRAKMTGEDIEESVNEFIEGIREERREKTGSADCP